MELRWRVFVFVMFMLLSNAQVAVDLLQHCLKCLPDSGGALMHVFKGRPLVLSILAYLLEHCQAVTKLWWELLIARLSPFAPSFPR